MSTICGQPQLIITDPEFLPKIPDNTDKIIINDATTTPNSNHITLNHITQTTEASWV
ncbi:hypothetical protein QP900_11285 [Corynebacterium marquesiae]|uniref:hypothetical protein n=1 Tax=Corynebacterium marquesiae TaxID=2913503 RepID=UPI002550EBEB|nr:hypothetical protein [Corynebacterium marquesiae]MDK8532646.1 hypothetical protein [Corynebacterium marquesiae]